MSNGGSGSSPLSRLLDGQAPSAEAALVTFRADSDSRPNRCAIASTSLRIFFLSWQKIPENGLDRLSSLPLQKFAEQGLAPCWIKRHVRSRFVLISNDCRGWSVNGLT